MASQCCPRCGLYSPQEAERCDCGYRFGVRDAPCDRCGARPTRYVRNATLRPPDPKSTTTDRVIDTLALMDVGRGRGPLGAGMPSLWIGQNLCRRCAGWLTWTFARR